MNHHHLHDHGDIAGKRLGVAFFLNVAFTIIELIGGYLTNSVAIMADALHDLGDSGSLGLAWYLERVSRKPGNETFTFGYRRFSLLGALITGLILCAGSVVVLMEAIPRLMVPEAAHPEGMFALALLGIVVNGAAVLRLKSGQSLNERMVSWHLLEDVIGWVAVLIASIVMYFYDLPILDPILSIVITLYILFNVFGNLKQVMFTFLQGVPPEIQVEELVTRLQEIENVTQIHHTHVWSQDGEHHVMTTHAVAPETLSPEQVNQLRQKIKTTAANMGIQHTTVEIELGEGQCDDV